MPLMLGLMSDGVRLTPTGRVDELSDDKVFVRDGVGLGDGERVAENLLNGTPDVDDLHAALEELLRFVRQVVRNAGETGRVRLVDVDASDGTAETGVAGAGSLGGLAADGMIEDEDLRCASSGEISSKAQVSP